MHLGHGATERHWLPLGGWYHASKYGVEALSDALRIATAPFGINIVVAEPGSIRTEWSAIAARDVKENATGSAYSTLVNGVAKTLTASSQPDARTTSATKLIDKTIVKIVRTRRPRSRYRGGFGSIPMLFLHWLLTDRVFDALILRAFAV
ncbi:hypothetical protein [Arthrobacter sp. efr-133-TYG-120]|uniref:hypothetical protein n=1 Tax=Arthrobacter sp. efr-133-TYG-120 TaxID=3040280 RepID=UPI00254DBFF7|nr:hypothetical protein [Arthrobacter sp. efr-133-TYG-120]